MEIDAEYDSGSDGKLYRQLNIFFINKSTIIYHYIMFLKGSYDAISKLSFLFGVLQADCA